MFVISDVLQLNVECCLLIYLSNDITKSQHPSLWTKLHVHVHTSKLHEHSSSKAKSLITVGVVDRCGHIIVLCCRFPLRPQIGWVSHQYVSNEVNNHTSECSRSLFDLNLHSLKSLKILTMNFRGARICSGSFDLLLTESERFIVLAANFSIKLFLFLPKSDDQTFLNSNEHLPLCIHQHWMTSKSQHVMGVWFPMV